MIVGRAFTGPARLPAFLRLNKVRQHVESSTHAKRNLTLRTQTRSSRRHGWHRRRMV
ncbi:hypothetical protein EMIT0P258_40260 [Pseudomonas sp. IT-P258]